MDFRKLAETLVFDSHAVWSTDDERIVAISRGLSYAFEAGRRAGIEESAKMAMQWEQTAHVAVDGGWIVRAVERDILTLATPARETDGGDKER